MKFLDTNIILRYLTRDDETKAQKCLQLFQKVEQNQETLYTNETIIAEVVFVLSSRSHYQLNHQDIHARLLPLLTLKGIRIPSKKNCLRALDIYSTHPTLDFEDALTVAHMEQKSIKQIYSYDTDFNQFTPLQRLEP